MQETIIKIGHAIDETGILVEITEAPSWKSSLLIWFGFFKAKRSFTVRPLTLGTMYRISAEIIKIPGFEKGKTITEESIQILNGHADRIAYIVALAFTNTKKRPDNRLKTLILENFTSKDLAVVLNTVLSQMSLMDFMTSIILIRGVNMLDQVSPDGQEETIAPGDTLEE